VRAVLISDVENKKAHAGYKARFDVLQVAMLKRVAVEYITTVHRGKTFKGIIERISCCLSLFKFVKNGDVIFINYPNNNVYVNFLFMLRKFYKIKLVAIIHDLDSLRKLRNRDAEYLPKFDGLISHNKVMSNHLSGLTNHIITSLDIFDYVLNSYPNENFSLEQDTIRELVYVGNLTYKKSSFIYDYSGKLDVWGNGFDASHAEGKKIVHKGVFDPNSPINVYEEYKDKLVFGLVWDGDSALSCSGLYGQYLKFNNPHKTSFYLSQNLPILIWKEAALASFILEHGCGMVIDSLEDAKNKIDNISIEEYTLLKQNAQKIGDKIRSGAFLSAALDKFMVNDAK
jgi:hypothetical protein